MRVGEAPEVQLQVKDYATPVKKFRCVAEFVFDPETYKASLRAFEKKRGLQEGDGAALVGELGKRSEAQSIAAAINYVFSRPVKPQRFNDESFDALYTAKEVETAVSEFSYYWKGDLEIPAVVFSVAFVGKALDLRPAIDAKVVTWPSDHTACQQYGKRAKDEGLDAIAAPSARFAGGSCCAILKQEKVSPLRVERRVTV